MAELCLELICSKTKLGRELEKKEILFENGYQEDVITTCFREKKINFSAGKILAQKNGLCI